MKDIKFRVWHKNEKRMYYRGYQKFLHVLLCDDDHGENEGKGRPVKNVSYGDCVFLETTAFFDKKGREVFEGDIVRVRHQGQEFTDVVDSVPDTFGNKAVHPLQSILSRHGIKGNPEHLDAEVVGNRYENPDFLSGSS